MITLSILFGIAVLSALGIIILDNYFDTFKYYYEAQKILSALGAVTMTFAIILYFIFYGY